MAIRFLNSGIVRYDSSGDVFTFQCMPRSVGVLRYRSDGGDRFEFVPPELMFARNDAGELMIGALGNAPATLEHPVSLIRHDAQTRETVQVGKVKPKVELYKDGTSIVEVEVYDSATIDAIRAGAKRGVSLGYQCGVKQDSGEWNGQRFTHRQQAPMRVDHLAIVANPRNPEALINRHDSADSDIRWTYTDSGLAVPESSNTVISMYTPPVEKTYDLYLDGEIYTNLDADTYVAILGLKEQFDSLYLDAAKCGRGWVGMQGNCKRAKAVRGMDKAQRQEFANSIRSARGMESRGTANAERKQMQQIESDLKGGVTASRGKKKASTKKSAAKKPPAREMSQTAKNFNRSEQEIDFMAENPAARKSAMRNARKTGNSKLASNADLSSGRLEFRRKEAEAAERRKAGAKKASRTRAKNKAAKMTPEERQALADKNRKKRGLSRREVKNRAIERRESGKAANAAANAERKAALAQGDQNKANRRKESAAKASRTKARRNAEAEFLANNPAAMKALERRAAKAENKKVRGTVKSDKKLYQSGKKEADRLSKLRSAAQRKTGRDSLTYFDSDRIPTRRYSA